MIDDIAAVVESLIKEKVMLPKMRYSGKLTMPAPLVICANMVEKTVAITIIMSKGLSTDHATPRKLRRYLSLKSLVTSCLRMKISFWISFFAWEATTPWDLVATSTTPFIVCMTTVHFSTGYHAARDLHGPYSLRNSSFQSVAASVVPPRMTVQQITDVTLGTVPCSTNPNTTAHAEYEILSAIALAAPMVPIPL